MIFIFGTILVITGAFYLTTYIRRHRWPLVQGTFDSVDVKIEATAYTEGFGFFVRPKYIQKIQYSYQGIHVVEVSGYEIITESPKLRVNPEKPSEAYLDNKSLLFPVLGLIIGIILILVSIKMGVGGTE